MIIRELKIKRVGHKLIENNKKRFNVFVKHKSDVKDISSVFFFHKNKVLFMKIVFCEILLTFQICFSLLIF